MNRRGFLAGIIAAAAAPAIVRAQSLMPIVVTKPAIIVRPESMAMQVLLNSDTGIVVPFCGETVPSGWLRCDGRALSRAAYPALFALIGNTYGDDVLGGFRVPDFRGHTLL